MNILFFLTPKKDVAFINESDTVEQALEKMEYHKYTALPILSKDGHYVGSINEGDLLWYCKEHHFTKRVGFRSTSIMDVPRRANYQVVRADANMEYLISMALDQNFVPVVDDRSRFIGIITRKELIAYAYEMICSKKDA